MKCKSCGIENEPDAKFCRECGQKLGDTVPPKSVAPDDRIKIGELIYTAYKHKEAGSIDDALLACQGALALNDGSAPAHALLGSLYELKGDIAAAIYEYGKAVELDPGSTANCRKLESLKSVRVAPPLRSSFLGRLENLSPYAPYAAFLAVFVIVVLLLSVALGWSPGGKLGQGTDQQPAETSAAQAPIPQSTPPIQPRSPQQYYQPPYGGQGQVQQRQAVTPGSPGAPSATAAPNLPRQAAPPASAPRVTASAAPQANERAAPKEPPVITPVIEPSQRPSPAPRRPAESPRAGPSPAPAGEPAGDPEQKGIQLQRTGMYQDAISAYREGLNRTSDPGRLYQQIALCHQRLGQHDMAIDNYNRAIRSYRDQLAAGRDPAEVQRNIRACEAGIDVSRSQER